jgi:hypothetical protein
LVKKSLYRLLEEWILAALHDLREGDLGNVKTDLEAALKIFEEIERKIRSGASFEDFYVEVLE